MLKIKDNVDIKELEKFGFKYNKFIKCYSQEGRNQYLDVKADYYVTDKRELQINTYEGDYTLDDVLYDLIKADLLEKGEG